MSRIFALLILLSVASGAQVPTPTLVLKDVTVIDGTGAPARPKVDVLIRGDSIVKIAPEIAAPSGARVIRARGKFLIPGLWDMHVHVWDADLAFPLFIANGVTGVRNMGGHADDLRRWRQEVKDGRRLGPEVFACGPVVDGAPPIHPDHSVVVTSAAQARLVVDELKSQAWDFVKVYDNLPRDAFFAVAAEAKKDGIPFVGHVPLSVTALEASNAGEASIEHLDGFDYVISPRGESFRRERLERIGKPPQPGEMMKIPGRIANEINQLAESYDESRAADLFAHLLRNGTWVVPTLSVTHAFGSIGSRSLYEDERRKYVARQQREDWEHNPIVHLEIPEYVDARKRAFQNALRTTRAAHQAGVPMLAGTDSGGVPYLYYGFSLQDELALLVEGGLSPMQALQAATSDASKFLGLKGTGTVEAGKRADLVLLDADPLADIRNIGRIDSVIRKGRLLDRHELDALLASVEKKAN